MRDTTPEAESVRIAAMRSIPPAERVRLMLEASDWHRSMLVEGLRRRFPGLSDLELVERALGVPLVPPRFRPGES